ncbi:MAG: ECF-type sigma factor [Isosphaeraceae bacterium]|nr:ECF-type sigma factor [Isosphaeraceae bacterium]
MNEHPPGSVSRLLRAYKESRRAESECPRSEIAAQLWLRYRERLERYAADRVRAAGGGILVGESAEVAAQAFQEYLLALEVEDGKIRVSNRDRHDLWRTLAMLARRVAGRAGERARAAKRGGGRVVRASEIGGRREIPCLEAIADSAPAPGAELESLEFCDYLLDRLDPVKLRPFALLKLEGLTLPEIAERRGCATRTVSLKLQLIRKIWLESINGPSHAN